MKTKIEKRRIKENRETKTEKNNENKNGKEKNNENKNRNERNNENM